MIYLFVAAQLASLVQGQVSGGNSLATPAVTMQAMVGGGCTPGDYRTCQLSGCAGAQQVCIENNVNGYWDTCSCAVQTCTGTPCMNAALSFDIGGGWLCSMTPKTVGTLCGNGSTCNGAERCDAIGVCLQGAPVALHDAIATTFDFCDAAGVVQHAPVSGGGTPQPAGQVYAAAETPGNPLSFEIPRMPTVGAPVVNENKGTLNYDYTFDLPKARGKFQPSLGLSYSSASTSNDGVGVGWSLSAFFIEAQPGAPGIDDLGAAVPTFRWWLQLGQSRRRLLPVAAGSDHYQTDLQGQFVSIVTGADGKWRATDTVGNQYVFGHHNARAGGSLWSGRFYLDSVVDVDGNTTVFSYSDVGTAADLTSIKYNNYKLGSTTLYATEIALEYVDLYPVRYQRVTDAVMKRSKMLKKLSIRALPRDATAQVAADVLWNDLNYTRIQQGSSLVLADITVKAGTLSLPPVKFTYSEMPGSYQLADGADIVNTIDPVLSTSDAQWLDVDGDGLVDRISGVTWKWQKNLTLAGAQVPSFAPARDLSRSFTPFLPAISVDFASSNPKTAVFLDFNGDGVIDIVTTGSSNHCEFQVIYGAVAGTGASQGLVFSGASQTCLDAYWFKSALPSYFPFGVAWHHPNGSGEIRLGDLDGDGALDLYEADGMGNLYLGQGGWTGTGQFAFASQVPMTTWALASASVNPCLFPDLGGDPGLDPDWPTTVQQFADPNCDLNGDGIPGDGLGGLTFSEGLTRDTIPGTSWMTTNWPGSAASPLVENTAVTFGQRWGESVLVPDSATLCGRDGTFEMTCRGGVRWWEPTCVQPVGPNLVLPPREAWVDLDGDGRVDRVRASKPGDDPWCPVVPCAAGTISNRDASVPVTTCGSACPLVVWWNTGSGFERSALLGPRESQAPGAQAADLKPDVNVPFSRYYCSSGAIKSYSMAPYVAGFIDLDGDGIADYVTSQFGGWRFFKGQGRQIQLAGVTTPTGATYSVTYAPAFTFGAGPREAPRLVPTAVSLTGPIPAATTSYSYASPSHATSPFDPSDTESRGFEFTWSWLEQPGATTKVAQRTQWAVSSHAFDGTAIEIAEGTFTGAAPSSANFALFRKTGFTYAARAPGNASCTAHSIEPLASIYPGAVTVATSEITQASVDGPTFVSSKARTCADVDDLGNSLRTYVDPDTSFVGDEYIDFATFDSTATCRTCPVETKRTTSGGTVIANSKFRYDSAQGTWGSPLPEGKAGNGHLNYVSRWVTSGTVRWEIESAIAYTPEGSVLSKVTDPYPGSHAFSSTETYSYDAQKLRVTDTVTQDASITLRKHVDFDPIHGWAIQETGPYVGSSSAGAPTRAFGRDAFGRVIATGRVFSGSTLLGTISATEYIDWSGPQGSQVPGLSVKTYSYLAPKDLVPGTIPSTPDLKQAIEYKDALGRTVQVKERLGTPGTPDAGAQIAQVLGGFRSVTHVNYDLAGRASASLEPYFTAEAQDDFATASARPAIKGSLTRFDDRGRVTCAQAGVYTAILGDASCTSVSTNSTSYRMSTRFEYRTTSSPTGRLLAATKTFPPSSDGLSGSVEAGYDGGGLLAITTDAAGNTVTTSITPVAVTRTVTVTRQAAGVSASAQVSTRLLDSMGRTLEETEDNWSPASTPSHRYTYDTLGRAYIVELAPQLIGQWNVRPQLRTEWKSLGRKTKLDAYEPVASGYGVGYSTRNIATYTYDAAFGGDPLLRYTAGHLASVTSPLTTIALGYDQFGQQERRVQWLSGLGAVAFTSTAGSAADGRLLWSQFDSPWSKTVTTAVRYDSAGRPVQVDANDVNGLKLWQVRNAANSSYDGYDVQGRTGNVVSNNGKVTTVRNYNQYSGSMSDQTTQFTAGTAIYKIGSFGYQGAKLTTLSDQTVNGKTTTVNYWYDPQGRLTSASASASGSSPISQSYTESYLQGDPSWPAGSSLGNLGAVTTTAGTTGYAFAADRVAEQYGAKANLLKYDHAGRLISRSPTATPTTELEGYAWDIQDQLRQVRTAGAVSEVLDYDPTGLPLFRRVGTVGTWYVGKMATVTATVSTSCLGAAACGASITPPITTTAMPAVAVHLLLGGTRIATVRPPNQAASTAAFAEVLYYHRDYQGSVVGTSRRGAGVDGLSGAKFRYTPYGQLDKADGVTALTDSELGYTGGLRLGWKAGVVPGLPQAPGLVLLGARVYHPELKRWLVPDTVDPLRYTYTGGDPVNFIDPSGRVMIDGHSAGLIGRVQNWNDFGVSLSVGMASSFLSAAVSGVQSVFESGGEAAALIRIAELDQQWVDRGGMESLERVAAIGSLYAYFSSDAPQGFTRGAGFAGPQGTSATQFDPGSGSGIARSFVAFRGTANAANGVADVQNAGGTSTSAHQWAVGVGQKFKEDNPNGFFAGHSFGGGLAVMAALATGLPAITFNATGVSDANLREAFPRRAVGSSRQLAHRLATNHAVLGEVVTSGQMLFDALSGGLAEQRSALGSQHYYVPGPDYLWMTAPSIEYHKLERMIPTLIRD